MLNIYFICLSYLLIVTDVVRSKPDYLFNYEAGGWLKLHRIPATWDEAYLRCHYEGAVLASPLNKNLADALLSQMKQLKVNSTIYLGTHDFYFNGYFISVEGVPLSNMEITWSSLANTGHCLTMTAYENKYDMRTATCEDSIPFICYRKLDNQTMNECGTFDDAYQYQKSTGSCYKVHRKRQTWSRAYGICASEGGYLVILNNSDEASIVKDMFPSYSGGELWNRFHVGLASWSKDHVWTTIHGESFEDVFNKWNSYQPNNLRGKQNRVSFVREGALDDVDPDFEAMFVCEKSPDSIQYEDIIMNSFNPDETSVALQDVEAHGVE